MKKILQTETADNRWRTLYRTGGISALAIALLLVGEVLVYSLLQDPGSPEATLELFLKRPLCGLLFFDLLGMVSYILFIPLILSLYMALRQHGGSVMLIGTVLFFIGVAAFFATNTAFSLLSLSRHYAVAVTEAEKAMLLASCRTMITLFDVNAFMVSYVIVSGAWLMMGIVMLRSSLFKRFTAWTGILAGGTGILAEVLENTSEALVAVAIAFYFAAIVFLFLWVLLTGRQLLSLRTDLHNS